MKKALYKVPNGKLLKIFLEDNGGVITSIKITGDFFTYPEENIEKLETALIGTVLSATALKEKIDEFLLRTHTDFFGLDAPSIVTTILNATEV